MCSFTLSDLLYHWSVSKLNNSKPFGFSQLGNSGNSAILCELLAPNYCSNRNRKIIQFDKEITNAKMNCSCEFLATK